MKCIVQIFNFRQPLKTNGQKLAAVFNMNRALEVIPTAVVV